MLAFCTANCLLNPMQVHRWMKTERQRTTNQIFILTLKTQSAAFDFDGLRVQWPHRTYGLPADPEYPSRVTRNGSRKTLRPSVDKWEFQPENNKEKSHSQDAVHELKRYPEEITEKDLEKQVAPAVRGHMRDFLRIVESRERPNSVI